jgi:hypothetical protein
MACNVVVQEISFVGNIFLSPILLFSFRLEQILVPVMVCGDESSRLFLYQKKKGVTRIAIQNEDE